MTADFAKTDICLLRTCKGGYSETFIDEHMARLPARVHLLRGTWFPHYSGNDNLIDGSRLVRSLCGFIPETCWDICFRGIFRRAFKKYLIANNIRAILAEYGPAGVAVMDVAREIGIPLIVHFHGYDAYDNKILFSYKRAYKDMFKIAAAVIAVSTDMASRLVSLGAPALKVKYIPYGVDLKKFTQIIPGENPAQFVGVGRFVEKKAPHLTLMAFYEVLQRVPEARLALIGDGPLLNRCRRWSRKMGIEAAVDLPGALSHLEVAKAMGGARAFIQHSVHTKRGDSEGTPVALLEAGAKGLPSVGTAHAGIKYVITHGKDGYLVNEMDYRSMSHYMIDLALDAGLANKLGYAARVNIENRYEISQQIAALWNVIAAAL